MARLPVRLHPAAADETDAAHLWYFARSPVVSQMFLVSLESAIEGITDSPTRWPRVYGKYRRYPLSKFPFSVVYVERAEHVEIVAVAHHRRRPRYWLERQQGDPHCAAKKDVTAARQNGGTSVA